MVRELPIEVDEYQEFAADSTFHHTQAHIPFHFFALGLTEEAGEFAGKVKKSIRGDYEMQDRRVDAALEIGDTLWYLSNIADWLGFSLSDIMKTASHLEPMKYDALHTVSLKLSVEVGRLVDRSFDTSSTIPPQNMCAIIRLIVNAADMLGFSLSDIMEMNIKKLTDRRVRGVMKGDGDNR